MNPRRSFRLFRLAVLVLLTVLATAAPAMVIRHDVPDAAYLARESEFPAVFALYRTKAGHNECIAGKGARDNLSVRLPRVLALRRKGSDM